jgi:transcriptional regulator with XRE-family HTH domain
MALPDDRRRMVGERLAELREQKALTLHELEKRSGVGADGISKIENGHRKPRPSTLRKLAAALGVEVEDFFREPAVPLAEAPREAGQSAQAYIDAPALAPLLDELAGGVQAELRREVQALERVRESGQPQERYPEYYEIAQRLARQHTADTLATALVVLMREDSRWGEIPELRRRIEGAYRGTVEYRHEQQAAEREASHS